MELVGKYNWNIEGLSLALWIGGPESQMITLAVPPPSLSPNPLSFSLCLSLNGLPKLTSTS